MKKEMLQIKERVNEKLKENGMDPNEVDTSRLVINAMIRSETNFEEKELKE